MNKNSKNPKQERSIGYGAALEYIQQVQLGVSESGSITYLTAGGATLELSTEPVTLGSPIVIEQPFVITITLADESAVPPITLKLNGDGDIVLTGDSEDWGWQSSTNPKLFTINTDEFGTEIIFIGPPRKEEGESVQQDIILVGTVPTP